MTSVLLRVLPGLLIFTSILQKSDGQTKGVWCVADEQTLDEELQIALDWACGKGGADCSKIQPNKPCFFPDTVRDHASYAFNNYYHKFKNRGASCYFSSAAIITNRDPSHGSCKFD